MPTQMTRSDWSNLVTHTACVRGVNSHLTWVNGFKVAAFDLPFRSISVSETIKIDGMKDQLYFRLVEQSILNMQVTSFGLRFSQLSVQPNYAQIITIF